MKQFVKFLLLIILISLYLSIFTTNALAATFTVTKSADTNDGTCDADCSLREAVAAAGANAESDTINFNISTSDGNYNSSDDKWTITLTSALSIGNGDSVTIDGSTQTGNGTFPDYGGKIWIETNGGFTTIVSAGTSQYLGLNRVTIKQNGTESAIINSGFNTANVTYNYFTRDDASTTNHNAVGFLNATGDVTISNNKIDLFDRAFWTTNTNSSSTTTISNNYLEKMDSIGIRALSVYNATVSGNTLTENFDQGILVSCLDNNCIVENNTLDAPNSGNWGAIIISGNGLVTVKNNTINTVHYASIRVTSPAIVENNTITGGSRHQDDGKIRIYTNDASKSVTVRNNTINVDAVPIVVTSDSTKARISQNVITSTYTATPLNLNGGTQDSNGVTQNDSGDSDSGVNDLMNFPVITSVSYLGDGLFKIDGNLDGNTSEGPFDIEIFNSENHSSGYGGSTRYLGGISTNNGHFSATVFVPNADGSTCQYFSSTATNNNGSTSEYSKNVTYGDCTTTTSTSSPTVADYFYLAPLPTLIVEKQDVVSLVNVGVFNYDAYLNVTDTPKTQAFRIKGTSYWQAGPLKEVWWQSSYNNAKILPDQINYPYTLIFEYDSNAFEPNLSKTSIKLAYSADNVNWKIMPNTLLNINKENISVVTNKGGYYMVVSPVVASY